MSHRPAHQRSRSISPDPDGESAADPEEALRTLRDRAVTDPPRETPPGQPRGDVQVSRRAVFIVGAIAVVVLVATGWSGYRTEVTSGDVAAIRATGELDDVRARNLAAVRGNPERPCVDDEGRPAPYTLACANQSLSAAGLATVPDPGPDATSIQVGAAVGEARGTLRALYELQSRGETLPGVIVPDPLSGRFPDRAGPATPTR